MDSEIDNAVGFLSYSHLDDEADEGRIRRLAKQIQSEYRVLTGQELEIFVDRSDLRWGQKWKERIDGALQTTTFFIPVLSPSFFASNECRREFFEFFNTTRSLGVPRYLLALRYAPVDDLVAESTDRAKAIAAETQYKNWEDLRLVDESSAQHRLAINELAQELRQLMREVQTQPAKDAAASGAGELFRRSNSSLQTIATSATDDQDDPYDDAPSAIELVAELPDRSNAWMKTMGRFEEASNEFNRILNEGTGELNAVGGNGNPFASKIVILRRVAEDLDVPARNIEQAGEQYMKDLLEIDPSFRALAELGHLQTSAGRASFIAAQQSVQSMVESGKKATESVQEAIKAGRGLARLSRDLRPPLKKYETGSQNILDGQAIMQEWSDLIDAVSWPYEPSLSEATDAQLGGEE
ncbi:toll/interleukin-1 receptor domain-containing protein [Arthrobacter antibioticus]|uniref:toll/interleukin-1 receptor domain-containing protein n=1 Tax=Arthrobacter sp. H35-MC1 TaxID=3046203 RepID=UPI0024BB58E4|nr:toll/interleukin-1 receptor domain-containing protein [Arthrobacter sp. H35-MC1]MDJ0318667.1 toll/interleukin-1 receptor domain-containing protein [Arthrobacter sp. H35-MC1]